jgi:hypothetical protein
MSGGSVNQSASIECSMLQGRQPCASVYIMTPLSQPIASTTQPNFNPAATLPRRSRDVKHSFHTYTAYNTYNTAPVDNNCQHSFFTPLYNI